MVNLDFLNYFSNIILRFLKRKTSYLSVYVDIKKNIPGLSHTYIPTIICRTILELSRSSNGPIYRNSVWEIMGDSQGLPGRLEIIFKLQKKINKK